MGHALFSESEHASILDHVAGTGRFAKGGWPLLVRVLAMTALFVTATLLRQAVPSCDCCDTHRESAESIRNDLNSSIVR